MALPVRKLALPLLFSLAYAFNALKKEVAAGIGSAKVHADVTSKPTTQTDDFTAASTPDIAASANASNLATSVTLANEIKAIYNRHVADDLAHKVGTSPAIATADASVAGTVTTVIALVNATKAAFNTHIASTTYHYAADGTNSVATADATDQTSANALANALKTALNAHIQLGLATPSLKLLPA
jgi:hypothetical protein